jgi:hypothetical protein
LKNELLQALNNVGTMLNLNKLNVKKKKSIFKNKETGCAHYTQIAYNMMLADKLYRLPGK